MKHMKFAFIAVALIAILSAFTARPLTVAKYRIVSGPDVNGKVILEDISALQEGTDFNCITGSETCTFEFDDSQIVPDQSPLLPASDKLRSQVNGVVYFKTSEFDPSNNHSEVVATFDDLR